jgi:RsiW-degrading membrane proteinase PrsW (M82 family)
MAKVEQSGEVCMGPSNNWWRLLLGGLALYGVGMGILLLTGNTTLMPTVVLLGNLVVPVAYVSFFYDRRHLCDLTIAQTAATFLLGGVLGIFAAGLLEPVFIGTLNLGTVFIVGLIEEASKIIGVFLIARGHEHNTEIGGLILGAAAGMGFATLESTGYAFNAFLQSGGVLSSTVGVTLIRGFLSPVGHGTWTAILAAVLFRESAAGRYRLDLRLVGAYLLVVFLHGAWDAVPFLISGLVLPGLDTLIGEGLVGAISIFILWRVWRDAVRRLMTGVAVSKAEAEASES